MSARSTSPNGLEDASAITIPTLEKHPQADRISSDRSPPSDLEKAPVIAMPVPTPNPPAVEQLPRAGSISSDHSRTKSGAEKDIVYKPLLERHPRFFYIIHVVIVTIMLIWPWIFVGVVWGRRARGGLRAPNKFAKIAQRHPHDVDFFVTSISSVFAFIMTYTYSTAITCFANNLHSDYLLGRFIESWKTPTVEWNMIRTRRGLRLFGVLAFYTVIFIFIESGLNAILVPHPFTRTATLQGNELDFSSTDARCLKWFADNEIPHRCNWKVYRGFEFTDCLAENQLVDVLESGRSNMQALIPNNNVTLTFTQMGGLQFLGPIHGVLPVGPNGIPAFDTVGPIRGSGFNAAISYRYTVDHQGASSNVSCYYDTSSPIVSTTVAPKTFPWFNGSCPSGETIQNLTAYPSPEGLNNTVGVWACKTSPLGQSYVLYFRGDGNYIDVVGNMTCVMSPVQHAVFPVRYSGENKHFSAQDPIWSSSNVSSQLIDRSVFAVTNTLQSSQGLAANLVAESVITYGVKNYDLSLSGIYQRNETYLRLFEAMILGIFHYEASYTRLIYSTYDSPPDFCKRQVNGLMEYEIFGWEAISKTAAYLIPLTLVNITSLIMFAVAMHNTLRVANRG